jgi:hypothetical protein
VELCVECGEHPRAIRSQDPPALRPMCRHCYNAGRKHWASRKKRRHGNARTVDEERVPMLCIEPVRSWLIGKRREFDTNGELAAYCRVDEKTVSCLLGAKQKKIHLDTVDKMFVAFGEPMELGRRYPELYDDPSVFA